MSKMGDSRDLRDLEDLIKEANTLCKDAVDNKLQ